MKNKKLYLNYHNKILFWFIMLEKELYEALIVN